jgi:hypothetical protein
MRKCSWIVLFVFAAIGVPSASAFQTYYSVDFTVAAGSNPATPPSIETFQYDSATGLISSPLVVTWDGTQFSFYFTFTDPDYTLLTDKLTWSGDAEDYGFTISDPGILWSNTAFCDPDCSFSSPSDYATGTISLTPIATTPEPGTAVLWLTGIGLMIVMMRKRVDRLRLNTGTHRSLSLP